MGHYASEMDPDFGQPSVAERTINAVQEREVRELASSLFYGFDTGSHLSSLNSQAAVRTAQAIDNLIKLRIEEATRQDSF